MPYSDTSGALNTATHQKQRSQFLLNLKGDQVLQFSFAPFYSVVIFLTMLAQVLHHPPQHQRHTIFHQAPLLQLKQGHSKQLGVLDCPGSQHGYLDHLLHVLFNLHCCLVVLQGGELILAVSHSHYGHRGQRWSRHQVRHCRDTCPGGGRLTLLHRLKGAWWCLCGVHLCTPPAVVQLCT